MYVGFKDEILLKQAPNCFYFYFGKQSYSFSTEINETAFQIIKLLNGQFTINEIIENLTIRYNEPSNVVKEKVLNFIKWIKNYI